MEFKTEFEGNMKDQNDPMQEFVFETSIDYDFDKLEWSYYEFGLFKRIIQPSQWINNDQFSSSTRTP